MSLHSRVHQYDVYVSKLFKLLETTEESDSGTTFRPVKISCCREQVRQELEEVMQGLKNTLKEKI